MFNIRKKKPEFDPFDEKNLKIEDDAVYLCGFAIKMSKEPNKVCTHENHQDSRVFCESKGFCSLKTELRNKTEVNYK